MDKLELAKYLLEEVGMPPKQQSTLCCLALLAMAKLTKDTPCRQASNDWIRIHDIIACGDEKAECFDLMIGLEFMI